jgi:hypothetical protein
MSDPEGNRYGKGMRTMAMATMVVMTTMMVMVMVRMSRKIFI